jgi:cystathionine gamma-synthase
MHPNTLLAQALGRVADPYRDIAPAIHPATTYERAVDLSYPGGRIYSRDQNPTYDTAEALLSQLEGGVDSLLFASGNAAAVAVFQSIKLGETILAPRAMYWALRKWLLQVAVPAGVNVEFYDNANTDDLALRCRASRPALIWVETPANPTWELTDIAQAAALAAECHALLAVDATAATPLNCQPLALGADIVMHSATKYLNGHSDVIAGTLTTRSRDARWEHIRYLRAGGGSVLGAFEAWLLLRGMRTLAVRMRQHNESAMKICARLEGHPSLTHVLYPGLTSHPQQALAARQMQGFGGMFSLRVKGGEAAAIAVVGRLRVWKRATSLGSVESLVEHRASVEGPGTNCPSDLVRCSTGIESTDDLLADLLAALG